MTLLFLVIQFNPNLPYGWFSHWWFYPFEVLIILLLRLIILTVLLLRLIEFLFLVYLWFTWHPLSIHTPGSWRPSGRHQDRWQGLASGSTGVGEAKAGVAVPCRLRVVVMGCHQTRGNNWCIWSNKWINSSPNQLIWIRCSSPNMLNT